MQSKEISFRVPGWMHREMIEMYTRLLREAVEAGWSGGVSRSAFYRAVMLLGLRQVERMSYQEFDKLLREEGLR